MNLREILEIKALRNGDKPLLICEDTVLSYAELDRRANRMANAFWAQGVRQNDRVAVVLWSSPDFFVVWLGLVKIGAWAGFVNPSYKGETLAHLISTLDPKAAVVSSDLVANFKAVASTAKIQTIVQEWPEGDSSAAQVFPTLEEFTKDAADTPPPAVTLGIGSIAGMVTTSGTTGFPKYLMLSHGYYFAMAGIKTKQMGVQPDDRFYLSMPLHHSHKHLATPLLMDSSTYFTPRFSVSRFWEDVRRYEATLILAHDQPLVMLLKAPPNARDRDHPARAVHPGFRMQREFNERFGIVVTSTLGNTESHGIALCCWHRHYTDPHYYDSDSPGLEINHDYYHLQVVDDEDRPVPAGTIGEIVTRERRPFTMFSGYYGAPEVTAERFRNGWYHLGDLGMIDERGLIHFKGRKAHSIRHRGEFVPHEAVENAAYEHAGVDAAVLVGVPSDLGDEDLKMYVVRKSGIDLSPVDLLDHLGAKVAYWMVPRYVEFVDEIPRNPGLDKINWVELKRRGIGDAWDREKAGYTVNRR